MLGRLASRATRRSNFGNLFPGQNTCHCGRRQGARPSPILRFGEGAQRRFSTARAGRSPDGLFQRAGNFDSSFFGALRNYEGMKLRDYEFTKKRGTVIRLLVFVLSYSRLFAFRPHMPYSKVSSLFTSVLPTLSLISSMISNHLCSLNLPKSRTNPGSALLSTRPAGS